MPQPAPYIPPRNADYVAWAQNFSTLISASPATYGLLAGDATAIAAAYTALNNAYALITSPSTKTAATVQAFNIQKASSLIIFRGYALTISYNAGVAPSDKVAVGVNPRTTTPTPIPTPTTAPVITCQSASTAGIITRYRDATSSPSVKAKPFGALGIQIYAAASATAITDPTMLSYIGTFTVSPFQLVVSSSLGKQVYIAGRWITRKGKLGPWSSVVNYTSANN
jgi:hypothetical protein